MFEFHAGSFSDLSETPMGRTLWQFLNSPRSVECLKITTYLRRPALEGLQPHLLMEFGDRIRPDRWKQMTGRMVRQIMESQAYDLDRTGVRIRVRDLFTTAARYREKDDNRT